MVINFSLFDNNTKEGEIKCKTGNATAPQEMNILLVRIDELTNLTLNQSFRSFPDPTGINLSNGTTDVINRYEYILLMCGFDMKEQNLFI